MPRRIPPYVRAVRDYVRAVKDLSPEQCNNAPLLLEIISNHGVHHKLAAVLTMLQAKGHFNPPTELLEGHLPEKVNVGVLEYLRDHGNTPNAVGLAQIAYYHGIHSRVLRDVLDSFKLQVPRRLPPVLRHEPTRDWRPKKPR